MKKYKIKITRDKITYPVFYFQSAQQIKKFIGRNKIIVKVPFNKFVLPKEISRLKLIQIDNGSKRKGWSPIKAKKSFGKRKRGLNLIEGLWLVVLYPKILNDHAIDLVASRYGKECVPTIYKWKNKIYLSAICPDVSDSMCGAPAVYKTKNNYI